MKFLLAIAKIYAVYKDLPGAFVSPLSSPEKTRDNAYQTEKQINNAKPSVFLRASQKDESVG